MWLPDCPPAGLLPSQSLASCKQQTNTYKHNKTDHAYQHIKQTTQHNPWLLASDGQDLPVVAPSGHTYDLDSIMR